MCRSLGASGKTEIQVYIIRAQKVIKQIGLLAQLIRAPAWAMHFVTDYELPVGARLDIINYMLLDVKK